MILSIGIIICLILLMFRMYYLNKKDRQMLIEAHRAEIIEERADAIARSKSVTRGQLSEHMISIFPDFLYKTSELRFFGAPIDYIMFKGMDKVRDNKSGEIEIIFADVKVGSAQRTKVQNAIKKAIEEKRVRWETWKIDENNKIKII